MTNKVITISRAFGSGGRTIGKEVARRLGIPYYDKALVDAVAKESGFHAEFIPEAGEYAPISNSFLFNIAMSPNPVSMVNSMSMADQLFVYQSNVIRELADKDNKRRVYYKHYTNRNWGEAQNYHVSLNSGLIGIEKCADIIVDIAEMYLD